MAVLKSVSLTWKIVTAATILVVGLVTCMEQEHKKQPVATPVFQPDYDLYARSEKCASCHSSVFDLHKQTAHYRSTLPATEQNIKGSFSKAHNIFTFNSELYIRMEKRDSGLYQVVYYQGQEKISIPFDIIIGSGTKGQSFMYWRDHHLFQTPMTYYTVAGQWANSPGFPNRVQYDRPITSRCMECHSTFVTAFDAGSSRPEYFDSSKMILGIGCEKCHGPGKRHVEFHTAHPTDTQSRYIVNPANLDRKRQMDICALCHGGRKEKIRPSFSFEAGDTLSDFFAAGPASYGVADVHGNQVALLESSKCFINSRSMTCNTCHNSHENERGKLASFSAKCMSCHQAAHKSIPGISVSAIKNNCIDCHMPDFPSNNIVLMTGNDKRVAAKFRTHHIAIYRDSTRQTKR